MSSVTWKLAPLLGVGVERAGERIDGDEAVEVRHHVEDRAHDGRVLADRGGRGVRHGRALEGAQLADQAIERLAIGARAAELTPQRLGALAAGAVLARELADLFLGEGAGAAADRGAVPGAAHAAR